MNGNTIISIIIIVADFFVWVVIASSLLSFFLPPYHPVREALGKIVDPFLNPIRSLMPSGGGLDFSPLILILIIELITNFLRSLL
ncbi:MAG TPA: YggT family protein [Anaerolineales bacterium]|nr:YggT family protein [Anaerolineales bacterium]HNB40251.1 YggT family protein [Anaerolineales bacterium]HND49118.1 YggT family protein [Anaerolineales bacterium]HNF95410.1 YggT family protein [Anaerolineales bacterium]HNH26618.1 YggT family protein [Anaerolineales bacterium]